MISPKILKIFAVIAGLAVATGAFLNVVSQVRKQQSVVTKSWSEITVLFERRNKIVQNITEEKTLSKSEDVRSIVSLLKELETLSLRDVKHHRLQTEVNQRLSNFFEQNPRPQFLQELSTQYQAWEKTYLEKTKNYNTLAMRFNLNITRAPGSLIATVLNIPLQDFYGEPPAPPRRLPTY